MKQSRVFSFRFRFISYGWSLCLRLSLNKTKQITLFSLYLHLHHMPCQNQIHLCNPWSLYTPSNQNNTRFLRNNHAFYDFLIFRIFPCYSLSDIFVLIKRGFSVFMSSFTINPFVFRNDILLVPAWTHMKEKGTKRESGEKETEELVITAKEIFIWYFMLGK